MLVHEHLRTTILEQLHQAPTRLAFFSNGLGQFFENSERHLAAFHVYFEASESRHADRILNQAAKQAMLMGGGAPGIPVFRRQAELAEETGAFEERLYALLALAFVLKQTGATRDADHALDQARATAQNLEEPTHFFRVREMEAMLDIGDKPRSARMAELNSLRKAYTENGDLFDAARMGTSLTTEYILGGDYKSAEKLSREVLRCSMISRQYGRRIARLNLAAALSGIGGREEEAAGIAQELQHELVRRNIRGHVQSCAITSRGTIANRVTRPTQRSLLSKQSTSERN